jgi:AcrR family transcriptional regulator
MGRKTGVTPAQTRAELVEAAARVFGLKGYDGASIADITDEAGLSLGSVYTHFQSKAELFVAVVREYGRQDYLDLIGLELTADVADIADVSTLVGDVIEFLTLVGTSFASRPPADAPILVEAIMASKRDPEVSDLITTWILEVEGLIASAIASDQESGSVDSGVDAAALARFTTFVDLGARLAGVMDLPAVNEDGWSALINHLIASIRNPPPA